PDGEPPGLLRLAGRAVVLPFRSLWDNATIGLMALTAVFFLTGWGSLLMTFSWEFGWNNSFHKGYEIAFIGPATGIAGLLLFGVAMMYVPMAVAHMAVTGDFRSFFEFRVVWRLIRARSLTYTLLLGLIAFFGLIQEIFKVAPLGFQNFEFWTNASDAE